MTEKKKEKYVTKQEFNELKSLVKKNLAYSQRNYSVTKKIHSRMVWGSVIKVVMIVGPIILAYIYVFPFLSEMFAQVNGVIDQYQNFFSQFSR